MDAISDVLSTIRFRGGVFLYTGYSGEWGNRFQPSNMAVLHCILSGSCWFGMQSGDAVTHTVQLHGGDIAFLPRGRSHFLANSIDTQCVDIGISPSQQPPDSDTPGSEADVRVLCAAFETDEDFQHPLFTTLPDLIHINLADNAAPCEHNTHVVHTIVKALEERIPGNDALINRLCEALLIQLLQHYHSNCESNGILNCNRNASRIYRVLEAIHQNPERTWTLNDMAELAHLSRSAFTSNFRDMVGMSPMSYLTSWRMTLARSLSRTTGLPMKVVAKRVGYRTQAGLNKAFKQFFGTTPRKMRSNEQ